jgi:hypothetical protein
MDTDEKSQKAWISHFIGNWLVQARFATSQGRSAEGVKEELVAKLNSRTSGTLVDEVEGLLREYKWESKGNVDLFVEKYREFEKKYGIGL